MKKLIVLLVLLVCVVCQAKEPFCQSYLLMSDVDDVNVFTVPQDSEFVLLYLSVDSPGSFWQIDIDDEMFLMGEPNTTKYFPDGIAIVGTGKTLKLKLSGIYTIAGYFRTICNESDLTGDCLTNFYDLAILANDWLE